MVKWNTALEDKWDGDAGSACPGNLPEWKPLLFYSPAEWVSEQRLHTKFSRENWKPRLTSFWSVGRLAIFQTGSRLCFETAFSKVLERLRAMKEECSQPNVFWGLMGMLFSSWDETLINLSNISNSKINLNWSTEQLWGCFAHHSKDFRRIRLHC